MKEIKKQTDRQTKIEGRRKWKGGREGREAERQAGGRLAGMEAGRQAGREGWRQAGGRQGGMEANRQAGRQGRRQGGREGKMEGRGSRTRMVKETKVKKSEAMQVVVIMEGHYK